MRIIHKLLFGFVAIITCVLLTTSLTLRIYRVINDNSIQLREQVKPHVAYLMQLYQGIVDLDRWTLTYILDGQAEQRSKIEAIIDQLEMNAAQHLIHEQANGVVKETMAREIQNKINRYTTVLKDILQFKQSNGEPSTIFQQKSAEYQTALNNLLSQIGEYRSMLLGELTASYTSLDEKYVAGRKVMLTFSLSAVLLALGAAVILTIQIVRPIRRLQAATDIIGKGQLNHRVDLVTGDEFGQLSQAFNHMLDHLEQTLVSVEELTQARQEADAANATKSRFLANVSHEIRTPLNSMISMAKLLHNNDLNNLTDRQLEQVDLLYQGSQRLLVLINNVLDISKIEAGKMGIEQETVLLHELLLRIEKLGIAQLESQEVTFQLHLEPGVPEKIISDEHKLYTILTNLVTNAIKFTPSGQVNLDISVWHEQLRFQVTDTGIGIAAHHLDQIFEEFAQAQTSNTDRHPGTGLGLSITKRMTELLGGTIALESQPSQGTTVTVCVPLIEPDGDTSWSSDKPATITDEDRHKFFKRTKPLLLVAEDDKFSRSAMRLMLEEHYDLVFAVNGLEAVKLYQETRPIWYSWTS